jgi:hypothetical protein
VATESQLVQVIAWVDLVLTRADNSTSPIVARIGAPQHKPTGDWGCAVELVGFGPPRTIIDGADSLQALALAMQLVRTLLLSLVANGAQLRYATYPPGSGYLDAHAINAMFGVAPPR